MYGLVIAIGVGTLGMSSELDYSDVDGAGAGSGRCGYIELYNLA